MKKSDLSKRLRPAALVVDDDESIAWVIEKTLENRFDIRHAATAGAAREAFSPDLRLIFLDIRLPDGSGLELLDAAAVTLPSVPVIMITAHGGMESAVEAMKRGAYDYLEKPFDLEELRILAGKALDDLAMREELAELRAETGRQSPSLIGSSAAMLKVFKAIGRVAPKDITVLITGESGTGKELVARAIHHNSPRAPGPFVALNVATLPRDLIESELFGSEAGAFTGAVKRFGKIEAARGGTLFLDEIGEMPPEVQASLLRTLEDGTVTRIGGTKAIPVDVRFVAATNRDLEEAVAAERFREDLYYRLNVFQIKTPALRERREDIPALAEHFLERATRRLATESRHFDRGVLDYLVERDWPGNVRELENAIKRAVVLSSGSIVHIENLRAPASDKEGFTLERFFEDRLAGLLKGISDMDAFNLYGMVVDEVDRALIPIILRHTGGNQVKAARMLGINRNTLRKKIIQLDISWKRPGE